MSIHNDFKRLNFVEWGCVWVDLTIEQHCSLSLLDGLCFLKLKLYLRCPPNFPSDGRRTSTAEVFAGVQFLP